MEGSAVGMSENPEVPVVMPLQVEIGLNGPLKSGDPQGLQA